MKNIFHSYLYTNYKLNELYELAKKIQDLKNFEGNL